jgi:hypothetical protein
MHQECRSVLIVLSDGGRDAKGNFIIVREEQRSKAEGKSERW